jgi:Dockerin type I domain
MRFTRHSPLLSRLREAFKSLSRGEDRGRTRSHRIRKLQLESLEERRVMTSLPFGAAANDTGEFLLGRIAVTPVLLESNGAIDTNVHNWTSSQVQTVLSNVQTGLNWWSQLLATKSSVHTLDWVIDRTYVDAPVPTAYEPIKRVSNDYSRWVPEFLNHVQYNQEGSIDANIRKFNDAQRQKHNADWAFVIFVVNSAQDELFAPGGEFSRAFAFAGGLYFITPSNRPASTYTHETGHMFWARDEYPGGGNYTQKRGYHNAQNLNAVDLNPTPGFQQSPSIMSAGVSLATAYDQVISPPSTLAQIGWQDSDNDGIFDVLDVPLELNGIGRFNASESEYRFQGKASAKALPNRNSSGLQSDITLNKIGRYEYRLNGTGTWTTISALQTPVYQDVFDLRFSLPSGSTGTIEIQAVESRLGITSNVFVGSLSDLDSTANGGVSGFAWFDANNDGQRQVAEQGLYGWTVQLVDAGGALVDLQSEIEPDTLPVNAITGNEYAGVTLRAVGLDSDGRMRVSTHSNATTGTQVFIPLSAEATLVNNNPTYAAGWTERNHNLEARFNSHQASVAVDVFGVSTGSSFARLEAFTATGELLERVTSNAMANGASTTLRISRASPDIAYVIVKAYRSSVIGIDNLRYGVLSETTTGNAGEFHFPGLMPGTYRVKLQADTNYIGTAPVNGVREVTLTSGQSAKHSDFGAYRPGSPHQNSVLSTDVNADGQVTPLDVLIVINALARNGSESLQNISVPYKQHVDVNGDLDLSPIDVLQVINYLRRGGSGEGELVAPRVIITEGIEPEEADGELPDPEVAHLYTGESATTYVDQVFSEPDDLFPPATSPASLPSIATPSPLTLMRRRFLSSYFDSVFSGE